MRKTNNRRWKRDAAGGEQRQESAVRAVLAPLVKFLRAHFIYWAAQWQSAAAELT